SNGTWTDLSGSLATAPPAGSCVGASGDLAVDPFLVSGSGLWRWNGAWTLVDNNVPPLDQQLVLGVLASGNPILVGGSHGEVQTHEFAAGSWVRRNNSLTWLASIAHDPLRGRLIGDGGDFVYSATPAAEVTVGSGCGAPVPLLVGEGI